jgi:uncharacterized coiled-coil DUF342 family protein
MSILCQKKTYRSPIHKLLPFFQSSRDGWKLKCQKAKRKAKGLYNQLAALKKNRNHWKAEARQYREQVAQLQQELAEIKSSRP